MTVWCDPLTLSPRLAVLLQRHPGEEMRDNYCESRGAEQLQGQYGRAADDDDDDDWSLFWTYKKKKIKCKEYNNKW